MTDIMHRIQFSRKTNPSIIIKPIIRSMFNKRFYILILPLILMLSCKDDEPEFPAEPVITMQGISPASAAEYDDNVVITIHYEDGDGDLGENTDGVKNCFV